MTKRVEPVPLLGGPMDGQTVSPGTRWPMYLEADGTKMPSVTGDRLMNGRSRSRAGAYVVQRNGEKVTGYAWRQVES